MFRHGHRFGLFRHNRRGGDGKLDGSGAWNQPTRHFRLPSFIEFHFFHVRSFGYHACDQRRRDIDLGFFFWTGIFQDILCLCRNNNRWRFRFVSFDRKLQNARLRCANSLLGRRSFGNLILITFCGENVYPSGFFRAGPPISGPWNRAAAQQP